MRQVQIDILDEIDKDVADTVLRREGSVFALMVERSRAAAHEQARAVGGAVVTDRAPEVLVSEGESALLGTKVLVAMRWWVEVPEAFSPPS